MAAKIRAREADEARKSATLEALLTAYADHLKAAGKPSWRQVSRAIERHVAPRKAIAGKPADEITVDDVMPIFHALAKAGKLREQELNGARAQAQIAYDARHRSWMDWMRCSGVPARGRNRTIENWRPQGRPQQIAAKLIRNYVADLAGNVHRGTGLTLLGPPGVGKTHLGCGLIACAYLVGLRKAAARHPLSIGSRTNSCATPWRSLDYRSAGSLPRASICWIGPVSSSGSLRLGRMQFGNRCR